MDTRATPEQAELRRAARQLARDLGPANVADLDDIGRTTRLADAVRDAGWLDLRNDAGGDEPLAGSVEVAIVADALGAHVADAAFAGLVVAADLARRAGAHTLETRAVAYAPALTGAAVVSGAATTTPVYVVDDAGDHASGAYVLVPRDGGYGLGLVRTDDRADNDGGAGGADLTRAVRMIDAGAPARSAAADHNVLDEADLAAWTAFGLALTSADLVGVMRGVIDVTVDYAAQRRQFGVPVGSFQAVQHLLADACCLMEGSASIALYAAWAADNLAPFDALIAGRRAKAYCARAARTVCETAVQVHGGIGNTWECMVHVYLRRALLSTQWFGDDSEQLHALAGDRRGAFVGLS
jgi:alkylation response protein AidB-like acyl-CoA dehydrogenase